MTGTIKSAINSGHGTAVLYGLGIGLVLSDVIPTVGDGLYFKIERNLRDKWKRGEITPYIPCLKTKGFTAFLS